MSAAVSVNFAPWRISSWQPRLKGLVDRTGNREHLPVHGRREPRRDQGAAAARRFDHQRAETQGGDERFRCGKFSRRGGVPSGNSLTSAPCRRISLAQALVAARIDDVDPDAQHGEGDSLRRERAAVRGAVDAFGEPAGDGESRARRAVRRSQRRCRGPAAWDCGCRRSRAAVRSERRRCRRHTARADGARTARSRAG